MRVLNIQDFSCMGRCSTTVALPIISSCQVECVSLPSIILSNHTQFDSFSFVDLNDYLISFTSNWDKYNNHFDYIYIGYISTIQIDNVISIIKKYKKDNTLVIIDPAMADDGKLYKSFDFNHVNKMKELISYADIVLPNLTEAYLLLGLDYNSNINIDLAHKLISSFSNKVILTGVKINGYSYTIYKDDNNIKDYKNKLIDGKYHGIGDLFASCIVGILASTNNINFALTKAIKVVVKAIKYTNEAKINGLLYGPNFEKTIPYLSKTVDKYIKENKNNNK